MGNDLSGIKNAIEGGGVVGVQKDGIKNSIEDGGIIGIENGGIVNTIKEGAVRMLGVEDGGITGIEKGAILGTINVSNGGLLIVVILLIFQAPDPSGNLRYILSRFFTAFVALAIGIGMTIIYSRNKHHKDVPETKLIAPTRLVFVGNPGVGKSTILNGFAKEAKFKSGFSSTGTLTTEAESFTDASGNTLVDTPGLSDFSTREKAAEEITKALKENSKHGNMKVIFLVKLDSGRVRATDTVSMKLVLDALPQDMPYGIVINQVSEHTHDRLFLKDDATGRSNFEQLSVCLNQGRGNKTPFIEFYLFDTKLSDQDNIVPTLSPILINFINFIRPCEVLKDSDIKLVRTTENEESIEKLESVCNRQMINILNNKKKFDQELKTLDDQHNEAHERLRKELSNFESGDKDVGPILSHAEASAKINRWLAKNPGYKWNGHWVSKNGTSYAGMICTKR